MSLAVTKNEQLVYRYIMRSELSVDVIWKYTILQWIPEKLYIVKGKCISYCFLAILHVKCCRVKLKAVK